MIYVQIVSTEVSLPKQWGVTRTKFGKLNYTWILTDLSFDIEQEHKVCRKSGTFNSTYDNRQNWALELCFATPGSSPYNSEPRYSNKTMSVNLQYLNGDSKYVEGDYTLTLMDETFHKIYSTSSHHVMFEINRSQSLVDYHKLDEIFKEAKNHSSRMNDTLVVVMDMSLRYSVTKQFVDHDCGVTSQEELQLIKRYYQSISDYKNCADLVIETKNGKNVTTSSCLFQPWDAISSGKDFKVLHVDFDFEVLNEIIHFLQYGEAPQMSKMAKDLFVLAKRYVLHDLKKLSEEEICNSLSLDQADLIQNLIFANKNEVTSVKSRIVLFLASQPAYYLDSPQFNELQKSHPDLMLDIHKVRDNLGME
ncbi:hypothetical protein QAD02_010118 [Eretmocerus hayati]|uniref:Uncharacterized protein n=1 Tax=Eretmocerus hayati TaxID=131215 RepID=A0ACC2NBA0_9HYME|nr:hypothetical protein QAD02_010118 [Eretmocerus hayati]